MKNNIKTTSSSSVADSKHEKQIEGLTPSDGASCSAGSLDSDEMVYGLLREYEKPLSEEDKELWSLYAITGQINMPLK